MVKKIKGIWIVLAIIILLFIVQNQNLFAAFPFATTLTKCIGTDNGVPCDTAIATIPGVVTISDFWKGSKYSGIACVSPDMPGSECYCGAGVPNEWKYVSVSSLINGWGCNETTYVYDCFVSDCRSSERRTKTFGVSIYTPNGCDGTLSIALPNGSSYYWNIQSPRIRFSSVYQGWNWCLSNPSECFPPSRSGAFESETVRISLGGYKWDLGEFCSLFTWSIQPKQFALDIVYDKTPSQVIVGTTSYIKAYLTSNITQNVNVKLNGQWSYLSPWGQKTEIYSTNYITLQPNVNTSVNIPVPTDYLFVLSFKFNTADVQYSIPYLTGGSSTITLTLPNNDVTIIPEPMICYSDADCPPPCVGKVGQCGVDNHCYFTGDCSGGFKWEWLNSIFPSFVTWLKGVLGWA